MLRRTPEIAGSSNPTNIEMMTITTSVSSSVNPWRALRPATLLSLPLASTVGIASLETRMVRFFHRRS